MARYAHVAISHTHAARARELASYLGIPVGALVSTLIDGAYENEFDIRPGLATLDGDKFVLGLGKFNERRVAIPRASGKSYVEQLRKIASFGGVFVDADHPEMIAISRQGSAVVIETKIGKQARRTMGEAEARRLADEIASFA